MLLHPVIWNDILYLQFPFENPGGDLNVYISGAWHWVLRLHDHRQQGALVRSCVQCGGPSEYQRAGHPLQHRSAPCSLTYSDNLIAILPESSTSSTCHMWTGDDFAGNHADAGKTSYVKNPSRFIWRWRMFRRYANAVRSEGTMWLSWGSKHSWHEIYQCQQ